MVHKQPRDNKEIDHVVLYLNFKHKLGFPCYCTKKITSGSGRVGDCTVGCSSVLEKNTASHVATVVFAVPLFDLI